MVTERDRRIIEFEERYGLVTIPTLQHDVFPECQPNAVVKVLSRLCKRGLLSSYPLIGRSNYYRAGGPLGPQTLPVAVSVLQYCVLSDKPKLTKEEMHTRFPDLPTEGQVYCQDGEGICQLRVSLGGASDALVRKLSDHHQGIFHRDGYRALVGSGQFSIKLLVPTETKARQLNHYLALTPPPFSVEPVVIPDLFQLICGVPSDAGQRLLPAKRQPVATGQVSGRTDAD